MIFSSIDMPFFLCNAVSIWVSQLIGTEFPLCWLGYGNSSASLDEVCNLTVYTKKEK